MYVLLNCLFRVQRELTFFVRTAEINKTDPTQYLLSLEQMIENDYPIPSYMADVFEKSTGWLETPEPTANESKENQKIYAIDCEMVRHDLDYLLNAR